MPRAVSASGGSRCPVAEGAASLSIGVALAVSMSGAVLRDPPLMEIESLVDPSPGRGRPLRLEPTSATPRPTGSAHRFACTGCRYAVRNVDVGHTRQGIAHHLRLDAGGGGIPLTGTRSLTLTLPRSRSRGGLPAGSSGHHGRRNQRSVGPRRVAPTMSLILVGGAPGTTLTGELAPIAERPLAQHETLLFTRPPLRASRAAAAPSARVADEGQATGRSERSDEAPLDTPYRAPRHPLPPEL